MNENITIRKAKLEDLEEIQKLFIDTVSEVCKKNYDDRQIEAWIKGTKYKENLQRWIKILEEQFVLIAQINIKIVGFISLDKGDYIDMLYVHKDYQRKGIASKLFIEIERETRMLQKTNLSADVSKTARAFFESKGFKIVEEKVILREGIELMNYNMKKIIV